MAGGYELRESFHLLNKSWDINGRFRAPTVETRLCYPRIREREGEEEAGRVDEGQEETSLKINNN